MSDQSAASAATNAGEYSVSEISGAIKRTVEDTFGYVRVRGEISGFRGQHSSGHAYFALKDEKARMEAVIWRGVFNKLKVKPEEGMEVIATGKVTTYPGSSKYQIVIERLEPAGVGALMALLEERKKKLQAEGIFDPARKQLLPYLPKVIGVVTSPTGAVIRDIMHRLSDRFPVHVLLWPVRVQGETSGTEVAAAIRGFNAFDTLSSLPKPDVLIVARGGGSLEDLWGFNDEAVVRAAAESDIPLISAVGHETDWTLIDYAADVRAPTPTGAAEMAVPVRSELISTLGDLHARNEGAVLRYVERQRTHLGALARALPNRDSLLALPRQRLDAAAARLPGALQRSLFEAQSRLARAGDRLSPQTLSQRIVRERQKVETLNLRLGRALEKRADNARSRLSLATARMRVDALADAAHRRRERLLLLNERRIRAYGGQLERKAERVARASSLIEALSYKNVLNRGFAVVRDAKGKSITKAANVTEGAGYEVQFADGSVNVTAGESGKPIAKTAPKRPKKAPASSDDQGSLF